MSKIVKPNRRLCIPIDDVTLDNIDRVFAYVNVGGKPRIIRNVPTAIDPNAHAPEFITDVDFVKLLTNKRKLVRLNPNDFMAKPLEKSMSIAEIFLRKPSRRTYNRIVFEANPEKVTTHDYNMWNGFAVRATRDGDWSLMDQMILESVADSDFESYLWIIRYCAWAVQNPTERAGVCLAMRSEKQGTGKGLLGRTMVKFFGAHAQHMYRQNALTARFNSQLAQCGILFEDESDFAGDKAAASMMKGLITEPTIDIERKGVDVITLPNCLKIIKATNRKWIAPVEAGDRRYAIFDTSEQFANDQKYFKPIYEQLENGGYGRMLYDLQRRNLKGWTPATEIPNTAARADQKTLSLPAEDAWLLEYLESGLLPYTNERWPSRMTQQQKFYDDAKRGSRELSFWAGDRFSKHLDKWGILSKSSNGHYRDFGSLKALRGKWMEKYPWYRGFVDVEAEWTYARNENDTTEDGEDPDAAGFGP